MEIRNTIVLFALFVLDVTADVCQQNVCQCNLQTGYVNCIGKELTEIPSEIPLNTTYLDLSTNNLTTISSTALKSLVNLTTLNLSWNKFENNGIEPGALDLPKLTYVDLSQNDIESFPSKVFPKSLTSLNYSHNNMGAMEAGDFAGISSLLFLDISDNGLEAIPSGLFEPLQDLKVLNINFNFLTNSAVAEDAFVQNKKLVLLDASFNYLEQILPNLPNSLKTLDYSGNRIKSIPPNAFKTLQNLTSFALWMSHLEFLEENAFNGLTNLQQLDVSLNNIVSNITKNTFTSLPNLKSLKIYMNNISFIEPTSFSSFKNITELWISDNKLKTLDPMVLSNQLMPHLSVIYAGGNPWYCDCHLKWLKQMSELPSGIIQEVHTLRCSGPDHLKDKRFDQLRTEDFVCK